MAIKHENGKVEGTITLRKLLKKVKKFFKNIWYRILYFFNHDSERVPKKFKKKMKKKRKNNEKFGNFSIVGKIALWLSGCNDMQAQAQPA